MEYIRYDVINELILMVYKKCNIKKFSFSCFDIAKQYDVDVYKYQDLSASKEKICRSFSDSSFKLNRSIYYNGAEMPERIRFSIAHELGHILLNHKETPSKIEEREANYFASNLLAPRAAIYYYECKNYITVARRFTLSFEAALYAFDSFKDWKERLKLHGPSSTDEGMYEYIKETNKIPRRRLPPSMPRSYIGTCTLSQEDHEALARWEYQRLYAGI